MDNNIQEQRPFPFFRLLRVNALLIVLITVLVTMLSVLYNILYVKPVYTVSRSVILRTELSNEDYQDGEATNAALAKDIIMVQMEQHFKSPKYVEYANKEFKRQNPNSDSTINAESIKITYKKGSLIFSISYSDEDKDMAINKLIALYDVNKEYFEDLAVANQSLIPTDNSENNKDRFAVSVNNYTTKYVFLGLGLGLVVAVAIVLIKNSLDNTVKDSVELEELTGASLIAAIHKQEEEPKRKNKIKRKSK